MALFRVNPFAERKLENNGNLKSCERDVVQARKTVSLLKRNPLKNCIMPNTLRDLTHTCWYYHVVEKHSLLYAFEADFRLKHASLHEHKGICFSKILRNNSHVKT